MMSGVGQLVAIDLPAGPRFVEAMSATWDAGDAVAPIDRRLPVRARRALLDALSAHAVIADSSGERIPLDGRAPTLESGDALVVATSGSTGTPKAVVHTFDSLTAHARGVNQTLGIDPTSDRWLSCLPLSHLGGLGVVVRSLLTDTPLDLLATFDADEVASAPERLGSTLVSLVPTALDRIDPAPYRWVVLGGAGDPLDRPGNVVHTYGLTETGGGVVYDGLPFAGTEVRVDADGAISLRGPTIARGLRQPDGSVVPVVDADAWLATGDLGRWADGALEVDGRSDDLIVSGGENVWPQGVEDAIRSHPGVEEVAVIGRADPHWGRRVVAVIVPANPMWPPTLEELRAHTKERLPAYAAPRELVVVHELERTALGKVRRPRFNDDAQVAEGF
jgi:O-succinylbenzoic acid--CoA ligase